MATTEAKTFQNYIGGEWVDAAGGETFESHNPATGETIGAFPRSSADDVDRAVEAAKEAYESWRLVPAPKRAEMLFRVGQRFIDRKDELTELMVQEMGKVRPEAGGDVQEAIDMTYYMAGEGRRLFGQTTPSEMPDKFQMSVRMPVGVVGIVWSAFGTSGQRCTAASRVIASGKVYESLQSQLVERAEGMRLGDGLDPETDVGPVINRSALEKIHSYTEIGQDEGAKLLTGGEIATENGLDKGFFYRPTIFADVEPGMRIAQEEIFGPTTALIRANDVDDAIRIANGIEYGLSSSIFTRDVNKAFRAIRDLNSGITYINAGTIGAEVHLPFGGTKGTGNGHREAGQAALDFYTEWKAVYVDYSGKLQRAQID